MKNLSLFTNGVAQFVIGSVAAANDIAIKFPGVVLNETANVLGAALNLSSDYVARQTVEPDKERKNFVNYYRDEHKADKIRQRYLNGSADLNDLVPDMPDWLKDVLKTTESETFEKVAPEVIVTDGKA